MEKAYAQALCRSIEKGLTPHQAVAGMKKALEAKGRIALLPKITSAFVRLAAREYARSTMTLSVAREGDMRAALEGAKRTLLDAGVLETDLCEAVDGSLIGGWRLEGKSLLLDRSWKKSLLSMYNRATSA